MDNRKSCAGCPYRGYALGISGYKLDQQLPEHLAQLERKGYPYDIVQLQWCVGSDNGPPDAALPEVVKNWNAKHVYPKLVIATTSELFREFEKRYAAKIPRVRGDFTPYWEDGASSTARETAINRTAAERLVQAETLWAMLQPAAVSGGRVRRRLAQRDPLRRTHLGRRQQHQRAGQAERQGFLEDPPGFRPRCRCPIAEVAVGRAGPARERTDGRRRGRVQHGVLAADRPGGAVEGAERRGRRCRRTAGEAVPSQRLSTGELAFLAKDVPALAGQTIHNCRRQEHNARQGQGRSKQRQQPGGFGSSRSGLRRAIVSLRSAASRTPNCAT